MVRFGHIETAHRISWQLHNGPIPPGMFVCHRCDNPPCVNPDHLFLGTHADNLRDASRKGRMRLGANNINAKLSEDTVRIIRALSASGLSQNTLSKQFGVAQVTIHKIIHRQLWKSVP
jgi:ribosome-binding protein aMBF1 (putative translation factor)